MGGNLVNPTVNDPQFYQNWVVETLQIWRASDGVYLNQITHKTRASWPKGIDKHCSVEPKPSSKSAAVLELRYKTIGEYRKYSANEGKQWYLCNVFFFEPIFLQKIMSVEFSGTGAP